MESSALKSALSIREKEPTDPGCLRMLITETFWGDAGRQTGSGEGEPGSIEGDIADRWHRFMPSVPINGQGYEGTFYYDCEWY